MSFHTPPSGWDINSLSSGHTWLLRRVASLLQGTRGLVGSTFLRVACLSLVVSQACVQAAQQSLSVVASMVSTVSTVFPRTTLSIVEETLHCTRTQIGDCPIFHAPQCGRSASVPPNCVSWILLNVFRFSELIMRSAYFLCILRSEICRACSRPLASRVQPEMRVTRIIRVGGL